MGGFNKMSGMGGFNKMSGMGGLNKIKMKERRSPTNRPMKNHLENIFFYL